MILFNHPYKRTAFLTT